MKCPTCQIEMRIPSFEWWYRYCKDHPRPDFSDDTVPFHFCEQCQFTDYGTINSIGGRRVIR